jgi:hypothetical protein
VVPIALFANGFTFSKLWEWFVVPTFSLPELTIPVAIGISMIVSFLTYRYKKGDDEEQSDREFAGRILACFVVPLFVLLFGWFCTLFM